MKTLVLNADYAPFDVISWKRAILQVYSEECPVVQLSSYEKKVLDTAGREHDVPAVLLLKRYVKMDALAAFSKPNIYTRDKHICAYCGYVFKKNYLTIDHVIPRSKWKRLHYAGTPNTFENVVTACRYCNTKKGDKLLNECNMKLLYQPKKVTRRDICHNKILCMEVIPEEWKTYVTTEKKS